MRRFLSVLTIGLVSAGLVACSDDATGPGDQLTEQEAGELAEVMFDQGFTFTSSSTSMDDATGFTGDPSLQTTSGVPFGPVTVGPEDVPCELGGVVTATATISGDIDDTGAGTMDINLTQVHNDCGVQSDAGTQFTLNGNPDTSLDLGFDVASNEDFTMTGSLGGGVAWVTGDRSGTCTVDLTISASGNFTSETISGTVTGTVCGRSINESFS